MQWKSFQRHIAHLPAEDIERIEKAYAYGKKIHDGQKRYSGEPYFTHPIAVAEILADMGADTDTIIVGLLHDTVEDSDISLKDIEKRFGATVSQMVDGMTKFSAGDFAEKATQNEQIESIRKLFTMMEQDVRVMVVKLVDRLHNMRTVGVFPDAKRHKFAKETQDIFVKVANGLCMSDIRDELEELCAIAMDKNVHSRLKKQRTLNQKLAESAMQFLQKRVGFLENEGMSFAYERMSWGKLHTQVDEGDKACAHLAAVNIVITCKEVQDCYAALGALHQHWPRVQLSFVDAISNPYKNGYRGLHTTIILGNGMRVRCKMRTAEMHAYARKGIGLHCFDAEQKKAKYLPWMTRLPEFHEDIAPHSRDFWESMQHDILGDTIPIYTVGETGTNIPANATALDAAFYILGNHALWTKRITFNGKEVSFQTPVERGVTIEIEKSPKRTVEHFWLQQVRTGLAITKIRHVLTHLSLPRKSELGKEILQQEFDRYGMGDVLTSLERYPGALAQLNVKTEEELFGQVAEGVLSPTDVLMHIQGRHKKSFRGRIENFFERNFFHRKSNVSYLSIGVEKAADATEEEVRESLNELSELHDVQQQELRVKQKKSGMHELQLTVFGKSKGKLDAFFEGVQIEKTISRVRTMTPRILMMQFASLILTTLGMWVGFLTVLRSAIFGSVEPLALYALMVPVLVCNILSYNFVSNYFARVRDSKWFLYTILFINGVSISCAAALMLIYNLDVLHLSFFFPLSILVLSCVSIVYIFMRRQTIYKRTYKQYRVSTAERKKRWRRKMSGYALRFAAVIIWGIRPLFIRYTPVHTIDVPLRVFLASIGGIITSIVIGLLLHRCIQKRKFSLRIDYTKLFFLIIFCELLYTTLMNFSLLYTSSTHVILLNNFAPVIALIIAALFWRDRIPYLRKQKHFLAIFCAFVLGSIGSSLLFFNDIRSADTTRLFGDFLATITMFIDVIFVIAMIQYVKQLQKDRTSALSCNIFIGTLIATIPVAFFGAETLFTLTREQLFYGITAGFFTASGLILNFESFKRIDGFLAFLMFNISILITFIFEAFIVLTVPPTWLLILGGLLIISSSILAEWINTRSETIR